MNVATLRNSISQRVGQVQNESFLASINTLLENMITMESQIIAGYDADFQPITVDRLEKEAVERVENAQKGNFLTQDQMLAAVSQSKDCKTND